MAEFSDTNGEKHLGDKHLEGNDAERNLSIVHDLEEHGELVTVDKGIAEDYVITHLTEVPHEEERRILRKVDLRVVPILTFLYLMSFVDRTNSSFYLHLRLACMLKISSW
jgi:hypothetical protein